MRAVQERPADLETSRSLLETEATDLKGVEDT